MKVAAERAATTRPGDGLQLKAFGTLALLDEGGKPSEAKIHRRQLAVLAVLAAHGVAGLTRDRLIGLLWPEKDQEHARTLLNTALWAARKALGGEVVVEGPAALHLNADVLPSDVADFSKAIERGDLAAAVHAYSGPFLDALYLSEADEFERWAAARRVAFAQEYVKALLTLAEGASRAGDEREAIDHLRRAAASDPLSGPVACALITALARNGDPAAALDAGRVHAALVREELEAEPGAGVLALLEEVREGKIAPPTRRAVATDAAPPPAERTAPTLESITDELARETTPSIAVLPFTSLSFDAGDELFTDGLTSEVINALIRLGRLRVAARTTVMAFKGKSESVRAIGRALRVRTILEGSVRRSGAKLRITATLIDVADGAHLWLGQFERELEDLFALQDEIAQAIAQTLQLSLLGVGFPSRAGVNTGAYERYLTGRLYRERRSPESLRRALAQFREAIAAQPDYALAYAGEADTLSVLAAFGAVAPAVALPRAREAAQRALALDPSLAEPHAALGTVLAMYEWDWTGAEREFRRSLSMNPQYQLGHMWYANYCLAPQGRIDEALDELRSARRLDPVSLVLNTSIGMVLFLAGRSDEAVARFQEVLELDPQYLLPTYFLGRAEAQRGRMAAAIEALERTVALSNGSPVAIAALAYAHARDEDHEEARALLHRLETMPAEVYVSPFELALVHVGLGDTERGVAQLARALEGRATAMTWLAVHPELVAVRSDPRVVAMLERLGLGAAVGTR